MKKRTHDPRQGGFTLVELMVVIILIGLFAGVVGVSVIPLLSGGKKTVALDQMKEMSKAIQFYWMQKGSYPETLNDLLEPMDGSDQGYMINVPLDPWKEPYEYDPSGGTTLPYDIFSKGEDKVAGTEDDVSLNAETEASSQ